MKRFVLLIAALLVTGLAQAKEGDTSLALYTLGYHYNNSNGSNNNFGAGLQYEAIERVSVGFKVSNNSLDRTSTAALVSVRFWNDEKWESNVGWQIANNYRTRKYQSDTKQFVIANVCRAIDETKWKACVSYNIWQQGNYTAYSNLNFKYTF